MKSKILVFLLSFICFCFPVFASSVVPVENKNLMPSCCINMRQWEIYQIGSEITLVLSESPMEWTSYTTDLGTSKVQLKPTQNSHVSFLKYDPVKKSYKYREHNDFKVSDIYVGGIPSDIKTYGVAKRVDADIETLLNAPIPDLTLSSPPIIAPIVGPIHANVILEQILLLIPTILAFLVLSWSFYKGYRMLLKILGQV